MTDDVYTLGRWRPLPGREDEFVAAWRSLGALFRGLAEAPGDGTLLRSADDPGLFYSFGPWPSEAAVATMREQPEVQEAFGRMRAICEEMTPGMFRVVARS